MKAVSLQHSLFLFFLFVSLTVFLLTFMTKTFPVQMAHDVRLGCVNSNNDTAALPINVPPVSPSVCPGEKNS